MKFQHQSFGGEVFRPQPEIFINEDLKMFAIITPWGPRYQVKNVGNFLIQNYENFSGDEEMTLVFPKLKSLSHEENILRSLMLACNQWIFTEQNKETEYIFGYEMVCGLLINNQLVFAQIGHPFIYLDRPDVSLQALGHVLDLSGSFSVAKKPMPPLPSQLMGCHLDTHFSIFKLPVRHEDRLIFISRNFVPGNLLETPKTKRNIDDLALALSKDNKDMAFWLGLLSLSPNE